MKIVLVGFMGAGKTRLAPLLAQKLRLHHVEMDDMILSRSGKQTITQIFENEGEAYFRKLETEVAGKLVDSDDVVIATGGGIIDSELNIQHLKKGGGKIVYLESSFERLRERVTLDTSRPLFRNPKTARRLFEQRCPRYEKIADYKISSDRKTPEELCSAISKLVATK